MNRVKMLKNLIIEKEKRIKSLQVELTEAYANTFLSCKHCGKKSQVKKCSLIDYQVWDENTGSPCGGFWKNESHYWFCSNCEQFINNEVPEDIVYEMWDSFDKNEKIYSGSANYHSFS